MPPCYDLNDGLNKLRPIETIVHPSLATLNLSSRISGVEYVASYNWADNEWPTIIVPGTRSQSFLAYRFTLHTGSPREWAEPSVPFKTTADTGIHFVDQNGFRLPSSPLLPILKAADALRSDVDWPSIDFIIDRNSLRMLSRWIDGTTKKDFRIDLDLAGDRTILFIRRDKSTREIMAGMTFRYGFESATTKVVEGLENSTGHYRIIKYVSAIHQHVVQ